MEQSNGQSVAVKERRWSWGSFMFNPIVVIATKRYKMLFWYLFAFVPFLNIVFWLVFGIYMGFHGRDMVMKSDTFGNDDERKGFLKGIEHAGFILFVATIVIMVVGLAVDIVFFAFLNPAMISTRGMNPNNIQPIPTLPTQY